MSNVSFQSTVGGERTAAAADVLSPPTGSLKADVRHSGGSDFGEATPFGRSNSSLELDRPKGVAKEITAFLRHSFPPSNSDPKSPDLPVRPQNV